MYLQMLFEAWWFFLPALLANAAPGIARKYGLPFMTLPIWPNVLGKNKTAGAYWAGPLVGLASIHLQQAASGIWPWFEQYNLLDYQRSDLSLIGLLFGLGAVLGDHGESVIKRALNMKDGQIFWPCDQLDFLAGAILLTAPMTPWIGWGRLGLLVLFYLILWYPIGNWLGKLFGHRSSWF